MWGDEDHAARQQRLREEYERESARREIQHKAYHDAIRESVQQKIALERHKERIEKSSKSWPQRETVGVGRREPRFGHTSGSESSPSSQASGAKNGLAAGTVGLLVLVAIVVCLVVASRKPPRSTHVTRGSHGIVRKDRTPKIPSRQAGIQLRDDAARVNLGKADSVRMTDIPLVSPGRSFVNDGKWHSFGPPNRSFVNDGKWHSFRESNQRP